MMMLPLRPEVGADSDREMLPVTPGGKPNGDDPRLAHHRFSKSVFSSVNAAGQTRSASRKLWPLLSMGPSHGHGLGSLFRPYTICKRHGPWIPGPGWTTLRFQARVRPSEADSVPTKPRSSVG
eukprot:2235129-Rhodomonas_salina.9